MRSPEMEHLDEGTAHAWLDGALDADEAGRVEAHVAACAACAAVVAEARGLIAGASRVLSALDTVPGGVVPVGAVPVGATPAAAAPAAAPSAVPHAEADARAADEEAPPRVVPIDRARPTAARRPRALPWGIRAAAGVLLAAGVGSVAWWRTGGSPDDEARREVARAEAGTAPPTAAPAAAPVASTAAAMDSAVPAPLVAAAPVAHTPAARQAADARAAAAAASVAGVARASAERLAVRASEPPPAPFAAAAGQAARAKAAAPDAPSALAAAPAPPPPPPPPAPMADRSVATADAAPAAETRREARTAPAVAAPPAPDARRLLLRGAAPVGGVPATPEAVAYAGCWRVEPPEGAPLADATPRHLTIAFDGRVVLHGADGPRVVRLEVRADGAARGSADRLVVPPAAEGERATARLAARLVRADGTTVPLPIARDDACPR